MQRWMPTCKEDEVHTQPPTHGQRCWYSIKLCVVWDGKRDGPWWIGHAKSRVFSSNRRRDETSLLPWATWEEMTDLKNSSTVLKTAS